MSTENKIVWQFVNYELKKGFGNRKIFSIFALAKAKEVWVSG